MKKTSLIILLLALVHTTWACVTCNTALQAAIADDSYRPGILTLLSAFFVLTLIVAVLLSLTYHHYTKPVFFATGVPDYVSFTAAAALCGIGLGGFLDGIVFHQILQWHGMLTYKLPSITVINKSVNMFWDGIFHLYVLIVTFIGLLRIWKVSQKFTADHSGKRLAGGLLIGWGVFNITEGFINHHLLELHNVREGMNADMWNYSFLIFSALLMAVGFILSKGRKSVI